MHVVLVIGVLGFIFASEADPGVGANIGTGIGLLGMGGLSLPWSAPFLFGPPWRLSDLGVGSLLTALALGNVLIHAGLWALWLRRPLRNRQAQPRG